MSNYVILLSVLILFIAGCTSDEPKPPQDSKLIKEITEILDAIEKEPMSKRFLGHHATMIASSSNMISDIIAKQTDTKLLIEKPSISLPIMFERFEKLPKDSDSLILYFIVFEHTKSAEAVPYIADFFAYWNKEEKLPIDLFGLLEYAQLAAEKITNIRDLPDAPPCFL